MRLCLIGCLLAASLWAQVASQVEITAEPHHHRDLENAYVRVFNVEIPSGDATLLHGHRHDYIVVNLGNAQISNEVEGYPPVISTLQNGQTVFAKGDTAHKVRDLGANTFRNVTVELMRNRRPGDLPEWDEERGLNILEGGTQNILFVKDGVRVSEVELQTGGMVPRRHPGAPSLLIATTDSLLQGNPSGAQESRFQLKTGDVKWFPENFTGSLMNLGQQSAKFIFLEFPRPRTSRKTAH